MIQKYMNVKKIGPVVAATAGKDGKNGPNSNKRRPMLGARHNPGHPIVPPAALCDTTGDE